MDSSKPLLELRLELVVSSDLSFAFLFMACRGSGVRVSLAPLLNKSVTGSYVGDLLQPLLVSETAKYHFLCAKVCANLR